MLETRAWCYSRWARPAPELQGSDTAPRPVPRGAQASGTAAPCPNLAPGCSPHPKTQRERALRPDPSAPTPCHPDRLWVLCRRVLAAGWGRGASPPLPGVAPPVGTRGPVRSRGPGQILRSGAGGGLGSGARLGMGNGFGAGGAACTQPTASSCPSRGGENRDGGARPAPCGAVRGGTEAVGARPRWRLQSEAREGGKSSTFFFFFFSNFFFFLMFFFFFFSSSE